MKNLVIILICFYNFSIGYSQHNTSNWETYSTDEYSINYPNDWLTIKNPNNEMDFIILSPPTSLFDDFQENVNLITQRTFGYPNSLEQVVEMNISTIPRLIKNSKIIESEQLRRENQKYHQLKYTFSDNGLNMHILQHYWLIDNKLYVLTFTTKVETYEEYKEIGLGVLNSFKINSK